MEAFIKFRYWYLDSHKKLKSKYGQDINLIAGLIASISPQMPVARNLEVAEVIYTDYKKDPENFKKVLKNKTRFFTKYGLFKPHYNNIVKVIYHDFKNPLKLSGNKVYNFYLNLTGNFEAVTIDTWMAKYFGRDNGLHISKKEYEKYAGIIREEAKKLNFLPAELQAILWTKIRYENNLEPVSFAEFI